tara:strand:+ start:438 stop:761 length:324 start_codon:yes stop_codon:yes gene_type:complete
MDKRMNWYKRANYMLANQIYNALFQAEDNPMALLDAQQVNVPMGIDRSVLESAVQFAQQKILANFKRSELNDAQKQIISGILDMSAAVEGEETMAGDVPESLEQPMV